MVITYNSLLQLESNIIILEQENKYLKNQLQEHKYGLKMLNIKENLLKKKFMIFKSN